MNADLLQNEIIHSKQRGVLNFTHPEQANIIVAYVHGIFYVTEKQLLFVQDTYELNSTTACDEQEIMFDISLSEVIKVKKNLSTSILMCMELSSIPIPSNHDTFFDRLKKMKK